MVEVTNETVIQFTKLLIECGNVYEVQPDYTIKNRMTGETIMIAAAKDAKPLMIFHEGASSLQDVVWLNPFKECLGHSKSREWFFGVITTIAGVLTKYITRKLIEDGVKKNDDNYNQFALMSKIIDKVDATMLEEIDKLGPTVFVSVYYNKKEKLAEAQTELFSSELRDAFPKFRKKTWVVLETIFTEIFGSTDLADYRYRAKLLNIPETEAKLAVSIALIRQLGPFAKDFLGKDLHEQELSDHFDVLEGYSRLMAWAPVNNETSNKYASPTEVPWANAASPAPGMVPMSAIPGASTIPANMVPMTAPIAPNAITETGQVKMSGYGGTGIPVTQEGGYTPYPFGAMWPR